MKKLFVFAAAAIFAAALAVSCEKNAIEVNVAPAEGENIFTCVLPENTPDSKYSISEAGKVSWEVGDEIMIHGGKDGSARLLVTLTADDIISATQAKIALGDFAPYIHSDTEVDWGYYAQYPAKLVPEGLMYYECCFQGTDAPLMAACSIDNTFSFKNLCGIISYTVTGDFDKVVFAGNNKETVAFDYYQVRVRRDLDDVNYHKPGNGFPDYNEIKTVEKEVVADGSTVNYIYLPKGVNFGSGFTFKFYKNDELVKIATTDKAVNVDHGKLLPLGDITSKLETYVAPSTSGHEAAAWTANATNLGADGVANCYIISAPGVYKFPAVRGNDAENALGGVFGADLVWETYNNAEEVVANSVIAAVDYDDNWIYFKTPDTLKPGNALLAAKNNQSEIEWSWHIWIPATTIVTEDYGIHPKAMMDRNLGALNVAVASQEAKIDVTSMGIWYQWGRKDPFPGPRDIDTEGNYPGFATVAGTAISAQKIQLSLAESIKNPTVFARGLYVDGALTNNDWLDSSNGALWGDASSKSLYDPCPAGYRVPNREKKYSLWDGKMSEGAGWSFSSTNYWFTLGNPATVFPCAGYCDGGTAKTTFRTVLWNAHHDGDAPDTAYNIYVYLSSGAAKFGNYGHGKSRGYYVRCCLE